jgi:hypothetical protein
VHRSRLLPALALAVTVALAGCTSGATLGSSGTVTLSTTNSTPADQRTSTAAGTPTSISPTPVTPDGLATGTGVDDTTITLGVLVDTAVDRGFTAGVELWQKAVNVSGGICGRTISIASNGDESTLAAYPRIAAASLGLLTEPADENAAPLNARVSADQLPTLTATGSSATLTSTGPVVIAATADIQAINTLAYLLSTGRLKRGNVLGTLTDSSAQAANALAGARWWAQTNGLEIQSRSSSGGATAAWPNVDAVLVMADAGAVQATLDATAAPVEVVTGIDSYAGVSRPGDRLLVGLPAPAYGSDNPGAAAVAKAFVATGRTDPGSELMAGYGVAAAWGRLLTEACTQRSLTRTGVRSAMLSVGPASVDSLFGPSDPALVVRSQLPATRVSSVAQADPTAPAGLKPLIWLQAAPGIADYVPAR